MLNILLIFIGSGLGGTIRYFVSTHTHLILGKNFPYGTLFVNITGSLIIGFLSVIIMERFSNNAPQLRALLMIGLLGGYTTFSSFSIEAITFFEQGEILKALLYIGLSIVLCLVAAFLGVKLGRF